MRATRTSRARSITTRALAGAAALALVTSPVAAATNCPQTSAATSWSGSILDTDTAKNGVVFDSAGAQLQLQNAAGTFSSTSLGIADSTVFAAVADFDRDGWDDFVGVGEDTAFVRIYRNQTYTSPEPDWDDPNAVRTPVFTMVRELNPANSNNRRRPTAAGDFNGDGWPDVFRASAPSGGAPDSTTLWLNAGVNDVDGSPTFNAGYAAMASGTTPQDLGEQSWAGTSIQAVDYNGDRKLDLLVGSGINNGSIRVFLNDCTLESPLTSPPDPPAMLPCATAPHFTYASTLITNMGFPASARLPVFAYEDVDGDGIRDLVATAPSCCTDASNRLRLWQGLSGGGLSTTPQSIAFQGGGTVVFVADFSGDGKKDLIVGTDNWNFNADHGADSFYWVNNGTATPFSGTPRKLTSYNYPSLYDYDVGFVFNYDHDPQGTLDLMIADGNHTSNFYVQANRIVKQFVTCGDVASGIIDIGALSSSEMVVTGARLHPTYDLNGGSVQFYLSNEEPPNWVLANDCGDSSGDVCASFPRPVGRKVRWKATMCSSANHARTPTLTGISATFDYTRAREHFRAGAVVSDGVAYLGGFRQPGDRGRLFAINAGLTQTYWDAATSIDTVADGSRKLYTADRDSTTQLDFTVGNAGNAQLQETLEVSDPAQAQAVIEWVRSKRFGVGNDGIERSRLGSIETSTPALLGKPGIPIWYVYGTGLDKQRHQQFEIAEQGRPTLLMFGSKDGMVHALRTTPTAMTTAPSGQESWAYIPPKVASGMLADYTNSISAGVTQVASYPDGSPTLADYRKSDGSWATAAIIGGGNGGKSITAIDVTRTIATNGTVVGPTPMWSAVPGLGDAGQAFSKPSVARVLIGGQEKYIAIAATGIAYDNPSPPFTKGRVVSAYDLTDGKLLWKFQAQCAITSDIATFETDDDLEPDAPTLNGYVDRAVFADACGFVYKVNPALDLEGAWNVNTTYGAIEVDAAVTGAASSRQYALFSSRLSSGALGADSPIAGTLAVRADATTRVAIFFGTGGLESHATTMPNEFYAVYADTGEIRSKRAGTCSSNKCQKFYGGAVVTTEQVIFTATVDPEIGSASCDTGATQVTAVALEADGAGDFATDFIQDVASAVMGALYGDAGAVYFATLSGDVSRVGTPRATNAGEDSTSATPIQQYGDGNENSSTTTVGTTSSLTLMGWRQVY